jgi:hypothetical protein
MVTLVWASLSGSMVQPIADETTLDTRTEAATSMLTAVQLSAPRRMLEMSRLKEAHEYRKGPAPGRTCRGPGRVGREPGVTESAQAGQAAVPGHALTAR